LDGDNVPHSGLGPEGVVLPVVFYEREKEGFGPTGPQVEPGYVHALRRGGKGHFAERVEEVRSVIPGVDLAQLRAGLLNQPAVQCHFLAPYNLLVAEEWVRQLLVDDGGSTPVTRLVSENMDRLETGDVRELEMYLDECCQGVYDVEQAREPAPEGQLGRGKTRQLTCGVTIRLGRFYHEGKQDAGESFKCLLRALRLQGGKAGEAIAEGVWLDGFAAPL
jgi:hypothetical protein